MNVNRPEKGVTIACLLVVALATLAATAGCGDNKGGVAPSDCVPECTAGQICIDEVCVADGDATDGDTADADVDDDVDEDTEDASEDIIDPNLLDYQDPCDEDDECASGLCIGVSSGSFCSRVCATGADCNDWGCFLIELSGTQTRVCAPQSNLCVPCAVDSNCSGGSCIAQKDGNFCASRCTDDTDCPDDYTCSEVTNESGTATECVPTSGFCGDCIDNDSDGYGEGCNLGPDCDDFNAEINPDQLDDCDGIDNNCNDDIDEQSLCAAEGADSVLCVEGSCVIETCGENLADCNDVIEDGCETDLTSQQSCGACVQADPDADCNALSAGTGVGYQCQPDELDVYSCVETGCLNGLGICGDDTTCVDISLDTQCGGGCTDCTTQQGVDVGVCNVDNPDPFTASCSPTSCLEGYCDLDTSDGDCESIRLTNRCGVSCDDDFADCSQLFQVNGPGCDAETGECTFEGCKPNFQDCNGLVEDGCEANTFDFSTCTQGCFDCNAYVDDVDPFGEPATYNVDSVQTCAVSGCQFFCDTGFGDCNTDFTDGCEQSLSTVEFCNSCNNSCVRKFANSSGSCGGAPPLNAVDPATGCGLGVCDDGFVDLDGIVTTGCECSQSADDNPDFDGPAGSGQDTNCDSVDGDAIRAIFVSTSGEDDATCGVWGDLDGDGVTELPLADGGLRYDFGDAAFDPSQRAAPHACATIAHAMQRASDVGLQDVYVASGSYVIPASGLVIDSEIAIYGGYGLDFTTRKSDALPVVSTAEARTLVSIDNVDGTVRLDGLELRGLELNPGAKSSTSGAGDGDSVFTVWIKDSSDVVIANSNIIGGTGEGGENGFDGQNGAAGVEGGGGGNGASWLQTTPFAGCSNRSGGSGGNGGQRTCGGTNVSGGNGGNGGDANGDKSGGNGQSGRSGGGSAGSGGGSSNNGGAGSGGSAGSNGSAGASGNTAAGMIVGGTLETFGGSDGTSGSHGRGGGGGGGGGSEHTCVLGAGAGASGGGGGGGGSGGCAGTYGERGFPGGGAVAIVSEGSVLSVINTIVRRGEGGEGGDGGDGGDGGSGGSSGSKGGGSGGGIDEVGGSGGDGGSGGAGGAGGGGGGACGGPAIAIATLSGGTWNDNGVTFQACTAATCGGEGGEGGQGGRRGGGTGAQAPNGDDGCDGLDADTHEY